ncbi:ABC transporter permease [Limobrevibacterium gyesilva]|uniref:ABC transporter permease n=1 Tax=Limobrevibacterium gyesilva TaxID=2991712 RepID=A0AA41YPH7_9PROT|nr:ABC transporter permease [Limobrevibacterium gyesilva]MCW3475858.1 ABC transporter permease [Limobrevibacterium gyesilva]
MNEGRIPTVLLLAGAVILLFLLVPVVVVVLAAFSNTEYLAVPPQGFTLRWFAQVLQDETYLASIRFSLVLAVTATALAAVIALPACYALHQRWLPGAETIAGLLMSPLIFPAVVVGVALLQYAAMVGLRGSFPFLVLVHAAIVSPYIVRTVLGSLAGFDPALEDAARVLGTTRAGAFALVVLPSIRPGLIAGLVFAFITSFDEFTVTVFLLPPGQATLPVTMFTAIEQGVDPSVAAVSTLMIVVTGLLLLLSERLSGASRPI